MKNERQKPTIKVGTSNRGATVIAIHQDGVLLSTLDGSSLKIAFFEAENLFA